MLSWSFSVSANEISPANKNAVITGASRGVGFALVKELLEDKIKVIAIVRDKTSLEPLKNKYADQFQIIISDISTEQGQQKVVDNISAPTIDYLVHNSFYALQFFMNCRFH